MGWVLLRIFGLDFNKSGMDESFFSQLGLEGQSTVCVH